MNRSQLESGRQINNLLRNRRAGKRDNLSENEADTMISTNNDFNTSTNGSVNVTEDTPSASLDFKVNTLSMDHGLNSQNLSQSRKSRGSTIRNGFCLKQYRKYGVLNNQRSSVNLSRGRRKRYDHRIPKIDSVKRNLIKHSKVSNDSANYSSVKKSNDLQVDTFLHVSLPKHEECLIDGFSILAFENTADMQLYARLTDPGRKQTDNASTTSTTNGRGPSRKRQRSTGRQARGRPTLPLDKPSEELNDLVSLGGHSSSLLQPLRIDTAEDETTSTNCEPLTKITSPDISDLPHTSSTSCPISNQKPPKHRRRRSPMTSNKNWSLSFTSSEASPPLLSPMTTPGGEGGAAHLSVSGNNTPVRKRGGKSFVAMIPSVCNGTNPSSKLDFFKPADEATAESTRDQTDQTDCKIKQTVSLERLKILKNEPDIANALKSNAAQSMPKTENNDLKPRNRFSIAALTGGDDIVKNEPLNISPNRSPSSTSTSNYSVKLPHPIPHTSQNMNNLPVPHLKMDQSEATHRRLIYWLDRLSRLQPGEVSFPNLSEEEVREVIQLSYLDAKFVSEVCRLPCYPQILNNLIPNYKRDIPDTQSFANNLAMSFPLSKLVQNHGCPVSMVPPLNPIECQMFPHGVSVSHHQLMAPPPLQLSSFATSLNPPPHLNGRSVPPEFLPPMPGLTPSPALFQASTASHQMFGLPIGMSNHIPPPPLRHPGIPMTSTSSSFSSSAPGNHLLAPPSSSNSHGDWSESPSGPLPPSCSLDSFLFSLALQQSKSAQQQNHQPIVDAVDLTQSLCETPPDGNHSTLRPGSSSSSQGMNLSGQRPSHPHPTIFPGLQMPHIRGLGTSINPTSSASLSNTFLGHLSTSHAKPGMMKDKCVPLMPRFSEILRMENPVARNGSNAHMRVAFYVLMKNNHANLLKMNGPKSRPPWYTSSALPRPKPINPRQPFMTNHQLAPEAATASSPMNSFVSKIFGMMSKMPHEVQEQLARGFSGQFPPSASALSRSRHHNNPIYTQHHLPPVAIDLTRTTAPSTNSSDRLAPLSSSHFGFSSRNKGGKSPHNKRTNFPVQPPPSFSAHNNGYPPSAELSPSEGSESKRRRVTDVFSVPQPIPFDWRFGHSGRAPPTNVLPRYPFNSL